MGVNSISVYHQVALELILFKSMTIQTLFVLIKHNLTYICINLYERHTSPTIVTYYVGISNLQSYSILCFILGYSASVFLCTYSTIIMWVITMVDCGHDVLNECLRTNFEWRRDRSIDHFNVLSLHPPVHSTKKIPNITLIFNIVPYFITHSSIALKWVTLPFPVGILREYFYNSLSSSLPSPYPSKSLLQFILSVLPWSRRGSSDCCGIGPTQFKFIQTLIPVRFPSIKYFSRVTFIGKPNGAQFCWLLAYICIFLYPCVYVWACLCQLLPYFC